VGVICLPLGIVPGLLWFDFVAEIVYAIGMSDFAAELGARKRCETLRFGLARGIAWMVFLALGRRHWSMALPACPRRKCCTGCSVAPSVAGLGGNRIQSNREY